MTATEIQPARRTRAAPLTVSIEFKSGATRDLAAAFTVVLADLYSLYAKTKNFHWHMTGPEFRDYHLLLHEHAEQIFSMADRIAERVRKAGGLSNRSLGEIERLQHILDNDAEFVSPQEMMAELRDDNRALLAALLVTHRISVEHADVGMTSLTEAWIDETERRFWVLFEASEQR